MTAKFFFFLALLLFWVGRIVEAGIQEDMMRLEHLDRMDSWLATWKWPYLRKQFWDPSFDNGENPVEECEHETKLVMKRAKERREIEKRLKKELTPLIERCEYMLRCTYNSAGIEYHRKHIREWCTIHPDGWGCNCSKKWWEKTGSCEPYCQ